MTPVGIMALAALLSIGCYDKQGEVKRAFEGFQGKYVIYISKKRFTLEVFDRSIKPVATYVAGFGKNPDLKPKQYENDNRTPEGLYRINELLSIDADPSTASYKTLASMNKKFFRANEGHGKYLNPREDQGDNAYGPRFFGLDYPNDQDRQRYERRVKAGSIPRVKGKLTGIGFGIAIHGNNDPDGVGHPSSSGCIRLYNRDVIELEQYVQMGTPVIISPH